MREIAIRTAVIGSGCAGFNAADWLSALGEEVLLLTENVNAGTSRNTGSDKQTYYRLSLSGDEGDSVGDMAAVLARDDVDGDIALCEAAASAQCFYRLVQLGVPFPCNDMGEYVGYQTDHSIRKRASSAGPLTSKFMTEALESSIRQKHVQLLDRVMAVRILTEENGVCGLMCFDTAHKEWLRIRCAHVVLATGGPAGVYLNRVYPASQFGMSGMAFEAGAAGSNLHCWQYGLASVMFRWNVSGSYQQAIPRYVSVDANGVEHDFLTDALSLEDKLYMTFLKGYQWPFDPRKVDGSSRIDLLVKAEEDKGRKVYMDFRRNPTVYSEAALHPEAYDYLRNCGALLSTPFERLKAINAPAIQLYRDHGIDVATEMLQVSVCAQHHNGGAAVDLWWQTTIPGLFAAGECAGTHGITRPGGSALNAGQVGALRAAQYISVHGRKAAEVSGFSTIAAAAVEKHRNFRCASSLHFSDAAARLTAARRRMSDCAGAIRDRHTLRSALKAVRHELTGWNDVVGPFRPDKLVHAYKLRDTLLTQEAVLTAMLDFADTVGATRGSALYCDPQGALRPGLDELFRFTLSADGAADQIQEVRRVDGKCVVRWRKVRPLPTGEDFFENVWRQYRADGNIHYPQE